ncbi:MAG: EVE domain-containing protein [Lysobacterales bacterium]|jgi:predicted RNA-binding protein with PUA-like domain
MKYWLVKNEPENFSIDDLEAAPNGTTHWDGVRNYQARNFIRDQMSVGDQVFYYHSNCKPPGIVGICEVCSEPYPDHTALDPSAGYYDPKHTEDNPRWFMVDMKFKRKTKRMITLDDIRQHEDRLEGFALIRRGNRLSVMPVEKRHWDLILSLE